MRSYPCTEYCPYFHYCEKKTDLDQTECRKRAKLDWLLHGYDMGFITPIQIGRMTGNHWDIPMILKYTGRTGFKDSAIQAGRIHDRREDA